MTERKYNLGEMGEFISYLSEQETVLKDAAQQVKKAAEGILSEYTGEGADAFRDTQQVLVGRRSTTKPQLTPMSWLRSVRWLQLNLDS
ncbi:Uncharacterised protein [Mycobacteroides abscessus subsp. massiliense]|nr:Uncharacterised protein [Mycobacteroides abscessus subsp. massiliense]